jgi:REP element-mobilizing transposase RayT
VTFLITFTCYGCHLHGHESGSVRRNQNLFGSRLVEPDLNRLSAERRLMDQPPYKLDKPRRDAVLLALSERCVERGWGLLAAHIRTTHVHAVVAAEVSPERVMNDLKSYASRRLNQMSLDEPTRKRWTRHGSTRWLWNREDVSEAIRYVVDGQGEPLAVFVTPEPL